MKYDSSFLLQKGLETGEKVQWKEVSVTSIFWCGYVEAEAVALQTLYFCKALAA